MKLNKNGWGTMEMLLLSGGLLIALIVAIYFIAELYGSLSGAVGNRIYIDMEQKLVSAAKAYIEDYEISINGEYKITYEKLNDYNYIEPLVDTDGRECSGYVIANNNNVVTYKAYVSCENYETNNY